MDKENNPKLRITLRDEKANVIIDETVEHALVAFQKKDGFNNTVMWASSPIKLFELHMQTALDLSTQVMGMIPSGRDKKMENSVEGFSKKKGDHR